MPKYKPTHKLVRILLAGLLVLGFSSQAMAAKTLVFCSEGSPEGFDMALYTSGTTFDASSRPVYSRLVEFERGATNVIAGLAESWDISADGLDYTFYLRKGVKFHSNKNFKPSRDFNADDVIFTFMRQWKKDHFAHDYVSGAAYEYFAGMGMPAALKSIDKIDDYTVRFTLNYPQAPMLANLGMDFASILSKEYADNLAAEGNLVALNQEPIGTGPFQFVAYQKDAVIRYKAHDAYFRGRAAIDNLVYSITKDASVRYQKLKAGECHVMPYPNPADLESMSKDKDITLLRKEGLNVGYLAYNTQQEPFDNPRVRKALNMAVNKQSIIDGVFRGAGVAAKNPIPPTIWSYNDSISDDAYDPVKAKAILREEGVEDLSIKIWWMPVARPYNPNAKRMAELIQADFEKIGVKTSLVSYEWGEYLKRSKNIERDGAVLLGWTGDNGDPDNFLNVLLGCSAVGGSNRAQWCNQEFEALVSKAAKISDLQERIALYEQAQEVFKREAPWATIAHSVVFQPVRKEVVGFLIGPFGNNEFYGVDLK